MVDGRAEAGVVVDALIYSGPTIDVERTVFDSDNTVAVADEEAEESREGARPVGRRVEGPCRGEIG